MEDIDIEIHLVKENEIISQNSRSHAKFIHGIKLLMAKNYIDNLSEEVKKGMQEKAEQGDWPCKAPIGYSRNEKNHQIELDREKAPHIRKLFEIYAEGRYSLRMMSDIAYDLGLRSTYGLRVNTAGIHRILKNQIYYGDFIYKGKLFSGKHTPIVPKELYQSVQNIMRRGHSSRITKHNFAFRGLLKCHKCGCSMTPEIKKGKYIYYSCTQYKGKCKNSITENVLANLFGEIIRNIKLTPKIYEWLRKILKESYIEKERYHSEICENLQKRYNIIKKRIERAYQDKLDGEIGDDFWRENNEKWNDELISIESQLAIHRNANKEYLNLGYKIIELAEKAYDLFKMQTNQERRRLLDFILSNCTIYDGTLCPTYRKPFDILAKGPFHSVKRG